MLHRIAGPAAAVLSYLLTHFMFDMPSAAAWTLATTVWVAWWWITETVSLPVTSLLPFILLPLGGIANVNEVSAALGNPIILLRTKTEEKRNIALSEEAIKIFKYSFLIYL